MSLMSRSIGSGDGSRRLAWTFSILRTRNAVRICMTAAHTEIFSPRLKTLLGSFRPEIEEADDIPEILASFGTNCQSAGNLGPLSASQNDPLGAPG